MKYYSDKTKKVYDEVADLEKAEQAFDEAHAAELKKAAERKARAAEIEAALKEVRAAEDKYNTLVRNFVKDYGSYHVTYEDDKMPLTFFNPFISLFDF